MKENIPAKMSKEKIQKVLSQRGWGSRRKIEEMVIAGEIQVDGKKAVTGQRVDPDKETITVLGMPASEKQKEVYLALNKPKGVLSTVSDERKRKTVIDLIRKRGFRQDIRLYPVGRLDKDSEGLMLLTNDGELAYKVTHPSYRIIKKYRVEIKGHPGKKVFKNLLNGVQFKEGIARAEEIKTIEKTGRTMVIEIGLMEGKKREIRRMFSKYGFEVLSLVRISIGEIKLGGLPAGVFRELTGGEIIKLKASFKSKEE